MEQEGLDDAWRMYMADMSRIIVAGMSRNKAKCAWWRDIISDKPAQLDKTGQDIFNEIVNAALNRGDIHV